MRRSLILLSGGLDSTTALARCIADGQVCEAVSFNYGQKHKRELLSAEAVANYYKVKHTVLDLTGAAAAFAGSALTGGEDVPEGHYEDASMKKTVVPNRNMIMLSLAAGLAISRGIKDVVYAAHSGDHAIYPDCRPEFYDAVQLAVAIGNEKGPDLKAPFLRITKAEIAKLGAQLKVPFELTYSCYNGQVVHCGACGTCQERRASFIEAGVPDPTVYDPRGLEKYPDVQM